MAVSAQRFVRRPLRRLTLAAAGLVVISACRAGSGLPPQTGPVSGAPSAAPAAGNLPSAAAPVFPNQNRPDVRGTRGAVVSDHPLASAAAFEVLASGGNAVDAALAAAGVLAVVRPHMNGVGGDAFALFYDAGSGDVYGMNGSGGAGALATPEFFRQAGHADVPAKGPLSVSVPGAVHAWVSAHQRFATRPLSELLAPAVRYARLGFPVSTRLAQDFREQGGDLAPEAAALFLPGGAPPAVGSLLRNPALGDLLEAIGREGATAFYRGAPAEAISEFVAARGGYLRAEDLAAHETEWVEPIRTEYQAHTFVALPPNTQGVTQLQQLEMASHFDLSAMGHNSADYLHTLVEIKKLAFADRDRWIADPRLADVPVQELLDPMYLSQRAALVDATRAADAVPSGIGSALDGGGLDEGADSGDTVYLMVVDADGNAVSWIQSLFAGFGSGLLEPQTGVVLHNRGSLFELDERHPNVVAPGKRPFHTLTPLLALQNGRLAFTLGTPGGDAQTQSLLQVINNLLLFGMTPQQALEAPRYRSLDGTAVSLEDRISGPVRAELEGRGHRLRIIPGWTATFGGAQMIRVEPGSGTLTAGADPRREAYAIAH